MKTFKEFTKILTKDELLILEFSLIQDIILDEEILNEAKRGNKGFLNTIRSKIGNLADNLEKYGVKFKRQDFGLIPIFIKANINIVKAITLLISWNRANKNGNIKAQNEIKLEWQKLSKSFNMKNLSDFLMNLDLVTLHLITGPIHIFKALTGLELELFQNKSGAPIDTIIKTIENLKTKIKSIKMPDKIQTKIDISLQNLHKHISKI